MIALASRKAIVLFVGYDGNSRPRLLQPPRLTNFLICVDGPVGCKILLGRISEAKDNSESRSTGIGY